MKKCLYMICPTDFLEFKIIKDFDRESYFYSSLGNNNIDRQSVEQLVALIERYSIEEVTFILADDNHIILEALNNRRCLEINGLNQFYNQMQLLQARVENVWRSDNQALLLISCHLIKRMSQFQNDLRVFMQYPPLIKGKIYLKEESSFRTIYAKPIHLNLINLN